LEKKDLNCTTQTMCARKDGTKVLLLHVEVPEITVE
jgi:hypothetical protein